MVRGLVIRLASNSPMILTYKYRLKGKRRRRHLRQFCQAVNQVWNFCVQTQRSVQRAYRDGLSPRWPSYYDLESLTSETFKDLGIHAQTLQNICRQFVKSRDQHKKCPRFRHFGGARRSLGWIPFQKQSRQITARSVKYLGKTYNFFGAKRRPLPSHAKGGCFVEDARGRWWVCFCVEADNLPQAPDVAVGIDLGLKTLATLSTGEKIEAPRTYRFYEDKLIIAQRARNKTRVRALHDKIKNVRFDHRHKWTTKVAQSHRKIFVGNVSSSQLAKTRMAKSVYDAGWSMSRNLLRYKASRHEGVFQEIDEVSTFTTQTCSKTGLLPPERPRGIAGLGIREWWCSACGEIHDRDVNAAQNILILGLSAKPLAEESWDARGG